MKILKHTFLFALIAVAAARIFYGAVFVSAASIDSVSLMEKINKERVSRNIPTLLTSNKLTSAASKKTEDMLARGYFDHLDPQGNYVFRLVEASGYVPYKMLGENLAIDFSTEDGIIRAWIGSPSHRDNILREGFSDQGLSAQYGSYQERYTNVVTSLFGTLASSIALTDKKTVPQVRETAPSPDIEKSLPKNEQRSFGNEPAVLLNAIEGASPQNEPGVTPAKFVVSVPSNLVEADYNFYELSRNVFLTLFLIFILISFLDALVQRRKMKKICAKNASPILVTLAIASLLSFGIY